MYGDRTSNVVVAIAVSVVCAVDLIVMGRAVSPLVLALVVSYLLWIGQPTLQPARGLLVTYVAAVLVQCVHLVEEYSTGFYLAFPPVFGAAPWTPMRFVLFNLAWLGAFVLAGIGIAQARRSAYVVALFLALGGGIGNGLGHLVLSARRSGYFPGTYTGVLALLVGSALLRKLLRPTGGGGLPA